MSKPGLSKQKLLEVTLIPKPELFTQRQLVALSTHKLENSPQGNRAEISLLQFPALMR